MKFVGLILTIAGVMYGLSRWKVVQSHGLSTSEQIGWAVGYMFIPAMIVLFGLALLFRRS